MITATPPALAQKATRREWVGLAVLALPCLLYSMDMNVLALAVPHLTADLRPTATQLLWIVDIYGFLVAGFLITMGTLGDRIGRRRLLMMGAGAFGVASVFAAFATSAEMLIVARAVLGAAAATLAPSTMSLIRNMFHDARERTLAIGIWVGCFAAGSVLGPVVGGVLLEYFWWGSVFLIAVPIMLLLIVLGPLLLPEFRDPGAGALDVPSAVLATSAVLAIIYGMKRVAAHGADAIAVATIAAGLLIALVFVRRQRRLADPMIDLRLFRSPQLSAALSVNVVASFAAFGTFLFITQYFQLVRGMGPLETGLWLTPTGLIFMLGSVLAPIIVRRYEPRIVLTGGFLVTAAGYALLATMEVAGDFWIVLTGLLILCAGLAPLGTLTTDIVMSAAPPEKAGAASGISETSFEFGAALGVAVLGSIMTAIYRARMTEVRLPGAPEDAIPTARDTLAAALETAGTLEPHLGATLATAAREAYTQSMVAAVIVGAALALGAAAFCWRFLRTRAAESAATA